MSPAMLAKPPFSDIHFEGVFGLFDDNTVTDLSNRIKGVSDASALVIEDKAQVESCAIATAKIVIDDEFGNWAEDFSQDVVSEFTNYVKEQSKAKIYGFELESEITSVKSGSIEIEFSFEAIASIGAFIAFYPKLRKGVTEIWTDIDKLYSSVVARFEQKYRRTFRKKLKSSELRLMTEEEVLMKITNNDKNTRKVS